MHAASDSGGSPPPGPGLSDTHEVQKHKEGGAQREGRDTKKTTKIIINNNVPALPAGTAQEIRLDTLASSPAPMGSELEGGEAQPSLVADTNSYRYLGSAASVPSAVACSGGEAQSIEAVATNLQRREEGELHAEAMPLTNASAADEESITEDISLAADETPVEARAPSPRKKRRGEADSPPPEVCATSADPPAAESTGEDSRSRKQRKPRPVVLPEEIDEWADILRDHCAPGVAINFPALAQASEPGDIIFGMIRSPTNPHQLMVATSVHRGYILRQEDEEVVEVKTELIPWLCVARARAHHSTPNIVLRALPDQQKQQQQPQAADDQPAESDGRSYIDEIDAAIFMDGLVERSEDTATENIPVADTSDMPVAMSVRPKLGLEARMIFTAASHKAVAISVWERDELSRWHRFVDIGGIPQDCPESALEHMGILLAAKYVAAHTRSFATAIISSSKLALDQVSRNAATSGPATQVVWRTIAHFDLLRKNATLHLGTFQEDNPAALICALAARGQEVGHFSALISPAGEPPHATKKKISKQNSKSRFVASNAPALRRAAPAANRASAPLKPTDIPQRRTFWCVEKKDAKILAHALKTCISLYPTATGSERDCIWRAFLLFPSAKLARIGPPKLRMRTMRARLRGVADDAPLAIQHDEEEAPTSHLDRKVRAATVLAQNHLLGKAARALDREFSVLPEDIDERVRQLHPQGATPTVPRDTGAHWLSVETKTLLEVIRGSASGKAPGPSGWTEDLLLQAVVADPSLLDALASMLLDILNNTISSEIRDLLSASRFIPIWSPEKGKLRPIAIGEAILKIAESIAIRAPAVKEYIGALRHQFAFVEAGCEIIVHRSRADIARGDTLVSLDAKNAFNTLSRQAIFNAVFASEKLLPLRGLATLMYAAPSDLLSPISPGLQSCEGTRQGSVLGPLLFCVATQNALIKVHEAFPCVNIRAYIDDVSITGSSLVDDATRMITEELAILGLKINASKSFVVGCAETATQLGYTHEAQGGRLLGAWVGGTQDAEKQFTANALDRSKGFFEAVKLLKPELGLPVLSKCGVPRLSFLTRTHQDTDEVCRSFDESVSKCVRAFAHIKGELSEEQNIACHLPIRDGGLGVTMHARINKDAFSASKAVALDESDMTPQHKRVEKSNKILFDSLNDEWKAHVKRCAKGNQSWLHSCNECKSYTRCLQLRLRAFSGRGKSCRYCGFAASGYALAEHLLGCAKVETVNVATRHNAVRDVVAAFCRSRGLPATNETYVGTNANGRLRADTRVILPDEDLYIDYTVANSSADCHRGKSWARIEHDASDRKVRHYGDTVSSLGGSLLVFVVEAFGRLGENAKSTVKRLERATDAASGELSALIAATLWRVNGSILDHYETERE